MTQDNANRDTIIEEIHRTRERIAQKSGGDLNAMLDDARKRQENSGRAIWHGSMSNKPLAPTGTTPTD